MAVAIRDHAPGADERPGARRTRGWSPRPTATRDGDIILGHAACLRPEAAGPPA